MSPSLFGTRTMAGGDIPAVNSFRRSTGPGNGRCSITDAKAENVDDVAVAPAEHP